MNPTETRDQIIVDIEPIDPAQYRRLEDKKLYETACGRRNRMAIGILRAVRLTNLEEGFLDAEDVASYPPETHAFYALNLALTLLPDRGCRFRSVDFVIDFERASRDPNWPRVLRLRPEKESSEKIIKLESTDGADVNLALPASKLVNVKVLGSDKRTEEIHRVMVHLAAFGVGTRQAGWRFEMTDSSDIPLSPSELAMLLVAPLQPRPTAHFRVTAEIEIVVLGNSI
jgi:hypothetical protein